MGPAALPPPQTRVPAVAAGVGRGHSCAHQGHGGPGAPRHPRSWARPPRSPRPLLSPPSRGRGVPAPSARAPAPERPRQPVAAPRPCFARLPQAPNTFSQLGTVALPFGSPKAFRRRSASPRSTDTPPGAPAPLRPLFCSPFARSVPKKALLLLRPTAFAPPQKLETDGEGTWGQTPSRKSSAGLGWGLESTSCKRLRSLLGTAEKRENSFIQAVNEMSFAIPFHGRHVADPQHPRVAPAHTGGAALEGFWEGGDRHESVKTRLPLPQGSRAVFATGAVTR